MSLERTREDDRPSEERSERPPGAERDIAIASREGDGRLTLEAGDERGRQVGRLELERDPSGRYAISRFDIRDDETGPVAGHRLLDTAREQLGAEPTQALLDRVRSERADRVDLLGDSPQAQAFWTDRERRFTDVPQRPDVSEPFVGPPERFDGPGASGRTITAIDTVPPSAELGLDRARGEDVVQAGLRDCGVAASIAAVAHTHPETVRERVRPRDDGTVEVTLRDPATSQDRVVRVASGFPRATIERDGQVFEQDLHLETDATSWPAFQEKAVAATRREGYRTLNEGLPDADSIRSVMEEVSGRDAEVVSLGSDGDPERDRALLGELASGRPAVVPNVGDSSPDSVRRSANLIDHHVYWVQGVEDDCVKLRNPWGMTHPTRGLTLSELRRVVRRDDGVVIGWKEED